MVHLKNYYSYQRVLFFFFNSTIRKWDIALNTTLLGPLLMWKSSEVQNRHYCDSYVPEPLTGGLRESIP